MQLPSIVYSHIHVQGIVWARISNRLPEVSEPDSEDNKGRPCHWPGLARFKPADLLAKSTTYSSSVPWGSCSQQQCSAVKPLIPAYYTTLCRVRCSTQDVGHINFRISHLYYCTGHIGICGAIPNTENVYLAGYGDSGCHEYSAVSLNGLQSDETANTT
jgi:hypothetical protein